MKHVVMVSGGLVSWAVAEIVCNIEKWGFKDGHEVTLLFADTLIEDDDLYRFLLETTPLFQKSEFVSLCDGRDPWEVFEDAKFIGNSRIDPCSRVLKRDLTRKWLHANCDPSETTIYIGFSWDEMHRLERSLPFWAPWQIRAPLTEEAYLWDKAEQHARLAAYGIKPPRMYAMGFPHNNCGGFCVKAGHAQFKLLLEKFPERYKFHERREQEVMAAIGTESTVLKCRRGGTTKPLSLRDFRERLVAEGQLDDEYDWGGCACFFPDEYDPGEGMGVEP